MIYTTVPMSLMGSVIGSLVFCIIFGAFLLLFACLAYGGWRIFWVGVFVSTSFLWIYAAFDSYKLHKTLVNEKVVVTKVGNSAGIESRSTGRYTSGLFPVLYVQYDTPDGVISIRGTHGMTYPEKAYMYRNPKKYSYYQ